MRFESANSVGTAADTAFDLEETIGRGATADVYRVRAVRSGELYALKVLTDVTPSLIQRLHREFDLQQSLDHPNIVRTIQLLELPKGEFAILMELVEGPTLAQFIQMQPKSLGFTDLGLSDRIAHQILLGVRVAHEAGLVHRDLKPGNILLKPSVDGYVVKIADFGLAKALLPDPHLPARSHETRAGTPMGTPAYMAPEQIRNAKGVDVRADVFGLGAVLYEMLCGHPPFDGDMMTVLQNAEAGRYRRPSAILSDVPARMECAIAGALCGRLEDRVPDVATLAALWKGVVPPKPYLLPPYALFGADPDEQPASSPKTPVRTPSALEFVQRLSAAPQPVSRTRTDAPPLTMPHASLDRRSDPNKNQRRLTPTGGRPDESSPRQPIDPGRDLEPVSFETPFPAMTRSPVPVRRLASRLPTDRLSDPHRSQGDTTDRLAGVLFVPPPPSLNEPTSRRSQPPHLEPVGRTTTPPDSIGPRPSVRPTDDGEPRRSLRPVDDFAQPSQGVPFGYAIAGILGALLIGGGLVVAVVVALTTGGGPARAEGIEPPVAQVTQVLPVAAPTEPAPLAAQEPPATSEAPEVASPTAATRTNVATTRNAGTTPSASKSGLPPKASETAPAVVTTTPPATATTTTTTAAAQPVPTTSTRTAPVSTATATAAPATVMLEDLDVASTGRTVVITGQLSNANVRPLAFDQQGASTEFPNQYVVQFKGGRSAMGTRRIPVGTDLVSAVRIDDSSGKLVITVDSKHAGQLEMNFQHSGNRFTLTVAAP